MNVLLFIVAFATGIICGFLIGKLICKIAVKKRDKKIEENAVKVINGEMENKTDIDGKIMKVEKFKVRDENNEEVEINLMDYKNGK